MKTLLIFLLALLSLPVETAQGTIRRVPSQYATIQSAINASVHSDTVLVSDGTYYESIRFKGKRIVVASTYLTTNDTSHISRTIINGSQPTHPDSGSVVYFISGEDTTSALCGFTITGGTGTIAGGEWVARAGGGVFRAGSGARIQHNRIIGNSLLHDAADGAGIVVYSSSRVVIEHNEIRNNSSTGLTVEAAGGGIYLNNSNNLVSHNIITNNMVTATGICPLARGGGISAFYFVANVIDNIIAYNSVTSNVQGSGTQGGGLSIYHQYSKCSQQLDSTQPCPGVGLRCLVGGRVDGGECI